MIVLHSFHASHTRPSHTVTALQCFMRSVTVLVSCAVCRVLRFAVCFSVRDLSELVDLWHEMLKCTKWQFFTFHLLICGDNRPTDIYIYRNTHTHSHRPKAIKPFVFNSIVKVWKTTLETLSQLLNESQQQQQPFYLQRYLSSAVKKYIVIIKIVCYSELNAKTVWKWNKLFACVCVCCSDSAHSLNITREW